MFYPEKLRLLSDSGKKEWIEKRLEMRASEITGMQKTGLDREVFKGTVVNVKETNHIYLITTEREDGVFFNIISGKRFSVGEKIRWATLSFSTNNMGVGNMIFVVIDDNEEVKNDLSKMPK